MQTSCILLTSWLAVAVEADVRPRRVAAVAAAALEAAGAAHAHHCRYHRRARGAAAAAAAKTAEADVSSDARSLVVDRDGTPGVAAAVAEPLMADRFPDSDG